MTAPVLGVITASLLTLLVWVYLQFREGAKLLEELRAAQAQRLRELSRVNRLIEHLKQCAPECVTSEHFEPLSGPNPMSQETIDALKNQLTGQDESSSQTTLGLKTDIKATLDRVYALQAIEEIWREHLKRRTHHPVLRLLLKLNGADT